MPYEYRLICKEQLSAEQIAELELLGILEFTVLKPENDEGGNSELTEREREVLSLIASGYLNREIAEKLGISVGTVKNHVHSILDKLDVHTRKQAAKLAPLIAMEK